MIIRPENPNQLLAMLKSAPLVLYGMGIVGKQIAQWCDECGVRYIFADKDAANKRESTSVTVIFPHTLQKLYLNSNIVICSVTYYDEMLQELERIGVDQTRILSYKLFSPQSVTWSDMESSADWNLMRFRIGIISEWITEDIKSVVDYGAGKMFLQEYLISGVEYFSVDYIRRNEQTILCDLNSGDFPNLRTDAAICSGVLDFIYTAKKLLKHVCEHTKKIIIITYCTTDSCPDISTRRVCGYVSDLSEQEILEFMRSNFFHLEKSMPDPCDPMRVIYMFCSDIINNEGGTINEGEI